MSISSALLNILIIFDT
jgi:hypothetical protein